MKILKDDGRGRNRRGREGYLHMMSALRRETGCLSD